MTPAANVPAPAIELRGIDKHFGAVHANKSIDLNVAKGSIHGIIGENGAGKSTLMSILYGYYEADGGEILVDGKPARITTPQDAIAAGIGMVHQHFMLVDNFTVLENVILGAEGGSVLGPVKDRAAETLKQLKADYDLDVDPDASPHWHPAAGGNHQGAVPWRRDPDSRRTDRRPDPSGS